MKTIRFTAILMVAMALSTILKAQEQQLTVPLSEPGKPFKLNADMLNGSIKIVGYEGKDIIIDATSAQGEEGRHKRPNRPGKDGDTEGMHRINSGESLDVTAKERNNTVTISSGVSERAATVITVKVPQNCANMKLSTVNGGVITVSGVNSDFEVSNVNGTITMDNVSGSVVANTVNGNIKVDLKSADSKAPMSFTTLNGNVDVTFPVSFKANMKLKSDRDNIYTDFDLATDKSAPKVNKTAKDGMYRLTIDEWVYGKINGGGPEVMMKTMNGSIYIRKAK